MKQKRTPRSYKSTGAIHRKANARAKKEGYKLANVVEHCVGMYAEGAPAIMFGAMPMPSKQSPKK